MELDNKTPAMLRKGRLYKNIIMGLSWSNEVRVQVPETLWKLLKYGWPDGPLIKSMNGIKDPDNPNILWTAWMFQRTIIVRSNVAGGPYISLATIGQDARANPADTPTDGI